MRAEALYCGTLLLQHRTCRRPVWTCLAHLGGSRTSFVLEQPESRSKLCKNPERSKDQSWTHDTATCQQHTQGQPDALREVGKQTEGTEWNGKSLLWGPYLLDPLELQIRVSAMFSFVLRSTFRVKRVWLTWSPDLEQYMPY